MSTLPVAADSPTNDSESPPRDAPKKTRPTVTAIRNGLIVIALSILLLEIVLRLLGVADPILYERNEEVGYRLKPDQYSRYLGNAIAINSFGVRDPRPLKERDPSRQRVVCLGDSVTWGGICVKQDDLFTSIAERKLGNVEVINAGVNGYSTTQMARLYEHFLADLNPDVVVFCVIPRDFERPPIVRLNEDDYAFPEFAPTLALAEAIQIGRITLARRYDLEWLHSARPRWMIGESYGLPGQLNISSIVDLSQSLEGKSKTVVAVIPTIMDRLRWEDTRMNLRRLRRGGVPVIDLGADVAFYDEDFVDGVHLSADGHRKVGSALAAVIYEATDPNENDLDPNAPDIDDEERQRYRERQEMRDAFRAEELGMEGRQE